MAGRSDTAINSVRAALQVLTGAGELTRARAMEAAGTLLELPGVGDTSTRVTQLAEELLDAATTNHQLMQDAVRGEFERQLSRLGLVRSSDLKALQQRVDALEAEVAGLRAPTGRQGTTATAKKATAKKATATTSAGKKSAGANSPGTKPTAEKSAARKATTKKATTKKATATTSAGKKSAGAKSTTKKAATKSTTKKSASTRATGR